MPSMVILINSAYPHVVRVISNTTISEFMQQSAPYTPIKTSIR